MSRYSRFLTWPEKDLYIDSPDIIWSPDVKLELNFVLFLHNNSISIWHTEMILHTFVGYDPRIPSIDFWVNGPRSNFTPFSHNNYYRLNYNNDTSCMCCLWSGEDPYWFWARNIKGQGQTWKVWIYLLLRGYMPFRTGIVRSGCISLTWNKPVWALKVRIFWDEDGVQPFMTMVSTVWSKRGDHTGYSPDMSKEDTFLTKTKCIWVCDHIIFLNLS